MRASLRQAGEVLAGPRVIARRGAYRVLSGRGHKRRLAMLLPDSLERWGRYCH